MDRIELCAGESEAYGRCWAEIAENDEMELCGKTREGGRAKRGFLKNTQLLGIDLIRRRA